MIRQPHLAPTAPKVWQTHRSGSAFPRSLSRPMSPAPRSEACASSHGRQRGGFLPAAPGLPQRPFPLSGQTREAAGRLGGGALLCLHTTEPRMPASRTPGSIEGPVGPRRPRWQALGRLCSLPVPRETPVPLITELKFCSLICAIHINQVCSTLQENSFHPNENLTRGN